MKPFSGIEAFMTYITIFAGITVFYYLHHFYVITRIDIGMGVIIVMISSPSFKRPLLPKTLFSTMWLHSYSSTVVVLVLGFQGLRSKYFEASLECFVQMHSNVLI